MRVAAVAGRLRQDHRLRAAGSDTRPAALANLLLSQGRDRLRRGRYSDRRGQVDGKVIGSLVPGTTLYIIADRAQGTHKLTVHRAGESAGFEADAQIEDATSHYFEIGPVVETNIDQARLDAMGLKGHPMQGRFVASTPFMLYALDPIAGAGVITRLKSEPSLRLEPPSCETSPLPNAPNQLPEC
ncbi:MAG: hypothetical protein WDN50_07755 [Bradyrhizobium sp.]